MTGVAVDSPDNRKKAQLSPREAAENVRTITLDFPETPPATSLDDPAQPLDVQAEPSYLLSVTKAKAKAVRERGDATRRKVDRFRRRNVFPLNDDPPPAMGEHHP